jgi:endonuclease YncB( thermonuclease family)
MSHHPYEWSYGEVRLVRAIDGDSAVFHLEREYIQEIDFGFHIRDRMVLLKNTDVTFRFEGYNTPEVVGEHKAKGLEAKAELERVLGLGSIRLKSLKPDKYGGRYIAQVWVRQEDGTELYVNQHMLDSGFGKPYDGKGVKPV